MTTLPAFITELLAVALRGDPLGSLQLGLGFVAGAAVAAWIGLEWGRPR